MTIEISFSLDDKDIEYFRDVMNRAQDVADEASEEAIIAEARAVLVNVDRSRAPLFVRDRLDRLGTMIAMLEDDEWPLDGQERVDVVSALAYFHNPQDLIDDDVPVIGLIDDAIMIELVAHEIRHQLEAYDEFCTFRESEEKLRSKDITREDWLKVKQQELLHRMRERMGRVSRSGGSARRLTRFSFLR